jgi:hypothetical protein
MALIKIPKTTKTQINNNTSPADFDKPHTLCYKYKTQHQIALRLMALGWYGKILVIYLLNV